MQRGKYPPRPKALDAVAQAARPAFSHGPAAVTAVAPGIQAEPEPARELGDAEELQQPAVLAQADAVTAAIIPGNGLMAGADSRERRPVRFADHPRSRDIDTLAEPDLRTYARAIGMSRRDVEELSVDRLRSGAKSHVAHYINQLLD